MRRTEWMIALLVALVLAAPAVVAAQTGAIAPSDPAAKSALAPAAPSALTPAPAAPSALAPVPAAPLPPAAEPAAFKPYKGRVSADIVNIRCGPGLYYYPIATLEQGAQVSVEGQVDEWAALAPIESVYGLMKKSDVTVAADNVSGTVAAPTARVYASSKTATRHWGVWKTLVQGDKVKVLGPAGDDMLRVASPEGARIYVLSKYVSAGPVAPTPGAAEIIKEPGYEEVMKVEVKPTDPEYEMIKAVDEGMAAELEKPLEERQYQPLIDLYKDVAEKAAQDYIKRAALARVARLEALAERQADALKIMRLGDDLDKDLAAMAARRAEAAADQGPKGKPPFVAKGVVARMESLQGVDHPVKFKLVDKDGRPIVVLKSTYYDLAGYVGKVVGVRGTRTYYKEWRIDLVAVDDIEVAE